MISGRTMRTAWRRLAPLMLMTLSGCASSGPLQAPEPAHGLQLSRECEHLAVNIPDPVEDGRIAVGGNPKRAVGEYRVALGAANGNINATRTCQAEQRVRLEGKQ